MDNMTDEKKQRCEFTCYAVINERQEMMSVHPWKVFAEDSAKELRMKHGENLAVVRGVFVALLPKRARRRR